MTAFAPSWLKIFLGWLMTAHVASSSTLKTYNVYHSLTGPNTEGSFVSRGTISLALSDTNELVATPDHDEDAEKYLLELGRDSLQTTYYQIKVLDPETQQSVLASIPACHVRRSNLREEMILSLGQSGTLLSVSVTPLISPLAPPCEALDAMPEKKISFQTSVSLSLAHKSMNIPLVLPSVKPPPGYSWFPRSAGTTTNPVIKEQEEKDQNQSFFRKYWYLLLPLLISSLLGGVEEEPPRQSSQQSRGVAPASSTAAPVVPVPKPSASSSSATTTRQRRGKR